MLADLPPSSRNTRFSVSAPRAAMRLPTAVEPVNEIMSTRGSPVSTSPTAAGSTDVTTLNTPGGMSVSSATSLPIHVARVRRVGRGLQDDRAPGGERGRELRQVQHEREVPRRDQRRRRRSARATTSRFERHAEELVRAELVLPLVAVDQVDVPLHVVDAAVLLDRVREPDRRADLGDDLRPQLFLVLVERVLQLHAGTPCGTRGRSPSRSRRTPAGPRRSRAPCRPADASATGPMTSSVAGLMLSYVLPPVASTSLPSINIRDSNASAMCVPHSSIATPLVRGGHTLGRYPRPPHAHRGARPRIELLPPARRRRAPRRHLQAVAREKEMLRLGDDVTRHGRISARGRRPRGRGGAAPEAARRRARRHRGASPRRRARSAPPATAASSSTASRPRPASRSR